MSETPPLPIAVFLSGGGRSLKNLIDHQRHHSLPIDIRVVISSSNTVRGVQLARDAGIDTRIILKSAFPESEAYTDAMFGPCREVGARLVVMAGFLKHVIIPPDFDGRVINIHPSLLPSFGGMGMYGQRVHQAAIDRGVKVSGCTVHYVDNHYDNGPILLQRCCNVMEGDSAESLAARVFELECQALPDAIRLCVDKLHK